MIAWPFKQLVQIIVRYAVALLVGIVFVSLAYSFIISALSNSFFAKTMVGHLFLLMIYSVVVWHLVAQFLPNMGTNNRHDETQSVIITLVLVIAGIAIWLPELAPVATIDITLFVSTFTIAAGLSGFMMDWLKTKEWMLCRFINT
jgi:hypothetical protein